MRLSSEWNIFLDQIQYQNYRGYHLKPYELASVNEIRNCIDLDAYSGDPMGRTQHRKYLRHLIRKIERVLTGQRQMGDPSERLIGELEMIKGIYTSFTPMHG